MSGMRAVSGVIVDEVPAYLAMLDAEAALMWGVSSIRRPPPDGRDWFALAAAGSLARIELAWECGC